MQCTCWQGVLWRLAAASASAAPRRKTRRSPQRALRAARASRVRAYQSWPLSPRRPRRMPPRRVPRWREQPHRTLRHSAWSSQGRRTRLQRRTRRVRRAQHARAPAGRRWRRAGPRARRGRTRGLPARRGTAELRTQARPDPYSHSLDIKCTPPRLKSLLHSGLTSAEGQAEPDLALPLLCLMTSESDCS